MVTFDRLEQNITDVIAEEQIKLGYRSEVIHLYYPLRSLNRLLAVDCGIAAMHQVLDDFKKSVREKWGQPEVSNEGERFCLTFAPQCAEYVHAHMDENEFLTDFIAAIAKHGCTITDIEKVFFAFSDCVVSKKVEGEDFDYLIYFGDGKPNDYRYCITFEGCHVIYHRFTREDFKDLYPKYTLFAQNEK